MAIVEKVNR